eukprot:GEZU01014829.1.p1 GENE.GEZU01014829.1~~GEZU01014829.1.p1  ORF type:complete len:198 (-),score=43.94 GEZU01014829.1:22-591(-)
MSSVPGYDYERGANLEMDGYGGEVSESVRLRSFAALEPPSPGGYLHLQPIKIASSESEEYNSMTVVPSLNLRITTDNRGIDFVYPGMGGSTNNNDDDDIENPTETMKLLAGDNGSLSYRSAETTKLTALEAEAEGGEGDAKATKNYYEMLLVTVPVFSGYAALFALQGGIKTLLNIAENTKESHIFGLV